MSTRHGDDPRRNDIGGGFDLHVVLVHPEIPGNTGSIGRTCLGVGAHLHLVEPLGFSLDEKRVRRAGLDYWPRVPLRVWSDWGRLEPRLEELGAPYFFTSDADRDLWSVSFPRPTVLVFGKEADGLPREILRRHAGRRVGIPMADRALRSLNLSTSVGIGVYEVLRQWRETGRRPLAAGGADETRAGGRS